MPAPTIHRADQLQWACLPFDALTLADLYDLLHVRCQVFIAEQVAFQDLDYKDQASLHLLGRDAAGTLQAYARILPPGLAYAEPSIGRVLAMAAVRGRGIGHELMRHAIAALRERWPGAPIRIGAQAYLQAFYESWGFAAVSAPYDEDGIAHITMLRA